MNKLNDKGQRHGYWESGNFKLNYHNGLFHGDYLGHYDKEMENILVKGQFDMDVVVGFWERRHSNGQLYYKKFYL